MKLTKVSATKFGLKIKRLKKINGSCPKCEHIIDEIINANNVYECPCGYFSYYADKDIILLEAIEYPNEYWKLQALRKITIQAIRSQIQTYKFRCENFPDYKLDFREKLKTQIERIYEFNEQMKDKLSEHNISPIEFKEIGFQTGEFIDSPNI